MTPDWSFDFVEDDADPTPCYDGPNCGVSYHGTAVAGVAAAIGNKAVGVAGVAIASQVASLRVPLAGTFDSANPDTLVGADSFVDAIHYGAQSIYNVQQKFISIKNHSYGGVVKYLATEAQNYALRETAAMGMVHVLAAGNQRQDRNTKGRSGNPDGIAVAALAYDGRYADYSNYGASVFVTAPALKYGGHDIGITTTDISGFLGANRGVPLVGYLLATMTLSVVPRRPRLKSPARWHWSRSCAPIWTPGWPSTCWSTAACRWISRIIRARVAGQ